MLPSVKIQNRSINGSQPCLIIAEAGVNHNGDISLAHRLIDSAAKAGVDAVKFQCFVTEELIIPTVPKANYQVKTTGLKENQFEMLKSLELDLHQHAELKKHCEDVGLIYICTPYDYPSVDILERIGVFSYKIASTDTTNIPFLRYIAGKGKPVFLSTGMSTLGEIEMAQDTLIQNGLSGKVILLHCTSEYPVPLNEVNLRAISTLQQAFRCPVGFSDHTPGIGASPWAIVLGACVIEKHFTLDRSMKGPDHCASIEPHELKALVHTVRDVEAALGDGIKRPMPSEIENKPLMQKSLVTLRFVRTGEIISILDLTAKRPGFGLPPSFIDMVIGKRAARDIPANSILSLAHIKWELGSEG